MNLTGQRWAIWSPLGHPYPPRSVDGASPSEEDKPPPLNNETTLGSDFLSGADAPTGELAASSIEHTVAGVLPNTSIPDEGNEGTSGLEKVDSNISLGSGIEEDDFPIGQDEVELLLPSLAGIDESESTGYGEADIVLAKWPNVSGGENSEGVSSALDSTPTLFDLLMANPQPLSAVPLLSSEPTGVAALAADKTPDPVSAATSTTLEVGMESQAAAAKSSSAYDFLKDLPPDLLDEITVEFPEGTSLGYTLPEEGGVVASDSNLIPSSSADSPLPLIDFDPLINPPTSDGGAPLKLLKLDSPLEPRAATIPTDTATVPESAEPQSHFAQLGMTPDEVLQEFHLLKERSGGVLDFEKMDPFLEYFGELSGRELERLESLKQKKKPSKGAGRKKPAMAIRFPSQASPSTTNSLPSSSKSEPETVALKGNQPNISESSNVSDDSDSIDEALPQSGDAFQVEQESLKETERCATSSSQFAGSEAALTTGVVSTEKDVPVVAGDTEVEKVNREIDDVSSDALTSGSLRVSPPKPLFSSSFQGGTPFSSVLPSSWSALRSLIDSEHTRAEDGESQLKVKAEEDLD